VGPVKKLAEKIKKKKKKSKHEAGGPRKMIKKVTWPGTSQLGWNTNH
jgi:hypothetical protein